MIQVVQQPAEKPARETGRMQPSSAIQEAGAGAETKLEDALETISQLTARVEQLEADVMRIDRDAPQELVWGWMSSLMCCTIPGFLCCWCADDGSYQVGTWKRRAQPVPGSLRSRAEKPKKHTSGSSTVTDHQTAASTEVANKAEPLELTGGSHFEGTWSGDGWTFSLTLVVETISDDGAVEGRTNWVLRGVPAAHSESYGDKVGGAPAVELWKGKRDYRQLSGEGYETQDPAGTIATGKYQLVLLSREQAKEQAQTKRQVLSGVISGHHVRLVRSPSGPASDAENAAPRAEP